MGLTRTVVGILADDHHLELIEGALIEGSKDIRPPRIDAMCGVLVTHKLRKLLEIWLFEFGSENLSPILGNFNLHTALFGLSE